MPMVNWTFYFSFFQAAISSVHAATLPWRRKQRKAKNFVYTVDGSRFKSKVDYKAKFISIEFSCERLLGRSSY